MTDTQAHVATGVLALVLCALIASVLFDNAEHVEQPAQPNESELMREVLHEEALTAEHAYAKGDYLESRLLNRAGE